jgi:hypothetical protein
VSGQLLAFERYRTKVDCAPQAPKRGCNRQPSDEERAVEIGLVGDVPAQALPDVQVVLDEIEGELARGLAAPGSGRVGVDPDRMTALIRRLRETLARTQAEPLDDARYRESIRQAEAQGSLLIAGATRKAQVLLDGTRVKRLRQEQLKAIVDESRQRGETEVAEAYTYAQQRLGEVLGRAETAHRAVKEACNAARPATPSPARRPRRAPPGRRQHLRLARAPVWAIASVRLGACPPLMMYNRGD